jgi:hypothetical protein
MNSKPKQPVIKPKFQPKKITKKAIADLPDRMQEILSERFGLEGGIRKTLDSIGKRYGITRERVRQIEKAALDMIKETKSYAELHSVFDELKEIIDSHGGIVQEESFFEMVYPHDPISQNHLYFYLTLGDDFIRNREDGEFKTTWTSDTNALARVRSVLKSVVKNMESNKLFEEAELIEKILGDDTAKEIPEEKKSKEHIKNWLETTHLFGKNKLGHWGLTSSYNISTRGVRDYAYLVLHQNGSPMHFRAIAQAIADKFGRPVHVATCHNTLISDARFVLIGRGLYALVEWGYTTGTARDVIIRVMKKAGRPLTREEIVEMVDKERHLKSNTIIVNLNNPYAFKRNTDGTYELLHEGIDVPEKNKKQI